MQTELDVLRERLDAWRWLLLVTAAHDAGTFAALAAGPLALDDLVARLTLDRRAAYAVAEALVAGGFLERADDRYQLTDAARRLLVDPADPAYLAPALIHSRDLVARWLDLPEILKGRMPEQRRAPTPGAFTTAMAVGARTSASIVVERCLAHFPSARRVLDVGGGPGVHARAFLAKGVAVTILDLPAVIETVRPQWAGVSDVTLVGGDFTEGLPVGPFDFVLLGNVCHIYGPEENRRLFQQVAAVVPDGGGIAIIDFVRGRSAAAALFGVNMLVNTATGGTWSEAEYRAWLTEAGFDDVDVEDIGASAAEIKERRRQLIFARRTHSRINVARD